MSDIATRVETRFTAPMITVCTPPDTLLNPAEAKMSFR